MVKACSLTRRSCLVAGAATLALGFQPALAVTSAAAESLVASAVNEINHLIASGKSEAALLRDFKSVFRRYGDVTGIALTTLGPARRQASNAQVRAYVDAYSTYFTNKYGRRFREFKGGQIVIEDTRPSKSYIEVRSKANLRGQKPFAVFWRVSDRSGSAKIQNILIGGVNVLTNERNTIRGMLDRAGGDIDKLTATLRAQS